MADHGSAPGFETRLLSPATPKCSARWATFPLLANRTKATRVRNKKVLTRPIDNTAIVVVIVRTTGMRQNLLGPIQFPYLGAATGTGKSLAAIVHRRRRNKSPIDRRTSVGNRPSLQQIDISWRTVGRFATGNDNSQQNNAQSKNETVDIYIKRSHVTGI
jgi:hypothetical protein